MKVRTLNQNGPIITFYEDGDLIGEIDYSAHSDWFIERAINNWYEGILTVETIERHSTFYVRDSTVS